MLEDLETDAEVRAAKAENLRAFSGLKLLHIKRQLAELLNFIGRGGIFDDYTVHNISHINEMLRVLDWLIPDPTKALMSPADWLVTVLAVYFHDLGMLVTKKEYENRGQSGFLEYRDKVLFAGDTGSDYRAKVAVLAPEAAERFLYQEFVRHHHAERIRCWIRGVAPDHLGVADEGVRETTTLLDSLDRQFRRDLGFICESHHLDDLGDFRKYKVSQPYGNSKDETANLQYAAVLLRTADLLHMTSDRTPSIAFRLINPADPLSQQEWAKQMAVKSVRPRMGVDKEGKPDPNVQRDTIEVYAYFNEENGFFGLTSYLAYVGTQIRKSYDWVQLAKKDQAAGYDFPWRNIDDTNIETEGFIPETFEFTIDQARILDLLTGHTLYNDTGVVLRELAQNALDAVRLQRFEDKSRGGSDQMGNVGISWNSKTRTLTVEDSGTGMTQEIIESNLLKVGASRYQDPEFRKKYPQFSPISRFGIGVLSAFMVADNVEITTCSPDEDQVRQISLRSVHGRYLVRLLNKQTNDVARSLLPHGTRVRLEVRPSAKVADIIDTARYWIVVPECTVTVTLDDKPPIRVGFASPAEAVTDVLRTLGFATSSVETPAAKKVKVEERTAGNVTVAYAVEWSEYFNEWSFVRVPQVERRPGQDVRPLWLGTCVEGIRVEPSTPGFRGTSIVAIANANGPKAPKTNVARFGLELTPEREAMVEGIYSIYCGHVMSEVQALRAQRNFSLTWSAQEARYLLSPIIRSGAPYNESSDADLLASSIERLPLVLVERNGKRDAVSPAELQGEPWLWTIDCSLFSSAEEIIREVPGSASVSKLGNALETRQFEMPAGSVLCGFGHNDVINSAAVKGKEVDAIVVQKEQRRVDLRWSRESGRWRSLANELWKRDRELLMVLQQAGRHDPSPAVEIAQKPIETSGASGCIAVRGFGITYVLPETLLAKYINEVVDSTPKHEYTLLLALISIILGRLLRGHEIGIQDLTRQRDMIYNFQPRSALRIADSQLAKLDSTIQATTWQVFDRSAWVRKDEVA